MHSSVRNALDSALTFIHCCFWAADSMKVLLSFSLLSGLALLLGSAGIVAAVPDASITGTVIDPSRAVLSAAAVRVINLDTGVVRTTTTNSSGTYQMLGLQAGSYEVEVSSPQFT